MADALLLRLPALLLAEIAAMMRLYWKLVKVPLHGLSWE